MKLIVAIWAISILTSCASKKVVATKPVKKEPAIYWQGVGFFALSTFVLFTIKFKTQ